MWRIEITGDPAACRALWEEAFPRRLAVDLWETRACFHEHFRRPLRFVGARDELGLRGLLPLSWIEEAGAYGCFPGETWMGRTWLEQNRILARDPGVLEALLAACPGPYHLRYLLPDGIAGLPEASIDETGYLFHPEPFGFEMENYYAAFSHRTAKRLRREVAALSARLTLRRDDPADFDALVALNLSRFGERSYFADERFTRGFRDLLTLAQERGWLRMTALLDRDEPVAVDLGCVYQGVYTLLAGGTHGDYPGIAKVINLHHLERACAERLAQVDFLCGDFGWKTLFHLAPRPLYLIAGPGRARRDPGPAAAADALATDRPGLIHAR